MVLIVEVESVEVDVEGECFQIVYYEFGKFQVVIEEVFVFGCVFVEQFVEFVVDDIQLCFVFDDFGFFYLWIKCVVYDVFLDLLLVYDF